MDSAHRKPSDMVIKLILNRRQSDVELFTLELFKKKIVTSNPSREKTEHDAAKKEITCKQSIKS